MKKIKFIDVDEQLVELLPYPTIMRILKFQLISLKETMGYGYCVTRGHINVCWNYEDISPICDELTELYNKGLLPMNNNYLKYIKEV